MSKSLKLINLSNVLGLCRILCLAIEANSFKHLIADPCLKRDIGFGREGSTGGGG